MNIEFHYYTLHYLSRCAGFNENDASTIAIASQMVDECIAPWEIFGWNPDLSPGGGAGSAAERGAVSATGRGAEGRRLTQVTQNYVFWDETVARDIYRPFHFIPGDATLASARRVDDRAGRFVVTEDSPLSREILIAALRTKDLFRIGIALHAYADTWAHQNFSGDSEPQNAFDHSSPIPAAGHLHALKSPDVPRLVWQDPRLAEEYRTVDNASRFTAAASMIYRFLCAYSRRKFDDEVFVVGRLEELWNGRGASGDSAARASDYIVDFDVPPYEGDAWAKRAGGAARGILQTPDPYRSGYDRLAWLKNAATKASSTFGTIRGRIPESSFAGSAFADWNRAAQDHLRLCRKLFEQRGIA
ncbi:MAG TPA: DUF6765 family protein [Rectinemataceae bacterium]|nr:DUF6765 family protein [Rectinemataceae bacterium]